MIKIRLLRSGKKHNPFYRIVAIQNARKVNGKPIDILGFWHPKTKDKKISLDLYKEWITKGAKPSKAVEKIIAQ